ncbi:MAG: twin-arginine translocase subunit TatC, partial [Calditrichaeota bacterium]|nr:twin-arginine translocase subunit TatC [Calditrichota bacterium]
PVRKVPPPTQEMPFLEHLEELRWVVFRSLIGLIAGMIVCFIFAQDILQILTYPASQLDPPLIFQFLKVQGMLIVYLEIGFFGGLALALPLIFQQLWSFISPGLHQREKRYFLPLMISVTTLF